MYISRTTILSPAALTMGQKVSLFTSVTWPIVAPAVSKLDLTVKTAPFCCLLESFTLLDSTTSEEFLELETPAQKAGEEAIWCLPVHSSDGGDRTVEENWRRDIFMILWWWWREQSAVFAAVTKGEYVN